MSKEKQEISNKIGRLLKDNPLLCPAVNLTEYTLRNNIYTEEEWKGYEEETGNKRPTIPVPTNSIDLSIDIEELNFGKFLLWNIEQFKKGLEEEYA